MKILMDLIEVERTMKAFREKADSTIDGVFENSAKELESYAKKNAPWKDRTGYARHTLIGCSECKKYGKKTLAVVGKMSYSPSLERLYDGRFSILYPTILVKAEGVLGDVVSAVGGVTL